MQLGSICSLSKLCVRMIYRNRRVHAVAALNDLSWPELPLRGKKERKQKTKKRKRVPVLSTRFRTRADLPSERKAFVPNTRKIDEGEGKKKHNKRSNKKKSRDPSLSIRSARSTARWIRGGRTHFAGNAIKMNAADTPFLLANEAVVQR